MNTSSNSTNTNITHTITKCFDVQCYFLQKAHSTEQSPIMVMCQPGTHFTAESTDAMRTKCLVHGHNILMQSTDAMRTKCLVHGHNILRQSTDAMRTKCLVHGHNILMQPLFEPSISVFINKYPTHISNMRLLILLLITVIPVIVIRNMVQLIIVTLISIKITPI